MNFRHWKGAFLKSNSRRTATAKRNIIWSFLVKGAGIAVSLLMVPLTLGYLAEEEYGIWLTLSSMLAWIGFFDIGLTNGLRNKLTEALTVGDHQRAKIYLSTTFVLLMLLIAAVLVVFSLAYGFIDWQSVFNTRTLSSQALGRVAFITVAFFGIQFVLRVVTALYFAVQKTALADLLSVLGQVVALGVIWLLTVLTPKGNLLYVAAVFSAAPVLVLVVGYLIAFRGKYRAIRPSFRAVNFRYSKDLMGLGLNFFLVQSSFLILFTTSNFIITQLFGASDVTLYNIAFKYFSVVTMGFNIILAPLWSAYTEAYVSGEFDWIRKVFAKTRSLWVLSVLGTAAMVVVSPWVYRLWVGEQVASQIPLSLSVACALYVSVANWNNITSYLLNGVGKIRLQLIASIGSVVLYVPLSIALGKLLGIDGVLYAIFIALLCGAVIQPIQTYKIINQTAKGLWNK